MTSPTDFLIGCATSHDALVAWLHDLGSVDVTAPSMLPDWSVGHVLTHIARNADGCRNMLEGAAVGEVWPMYPGGLAQRNEEIVVGAPRSFAEQVADIANSAELLEERWMTLPDDGWAGQASGPFGVIPVNIIPLRRWREIEIHWLDLGLGYTWKQWPDNFVQADLATRRDGYGKPVADDVVALGEKAELAWLFSRSVGEGNTPPPAWF